MVFSADAFSRVEAIPLGQPVRMNRMPDTNIKMLYQQNGTMDNVDILASPAAARI
jgi:hypothetical protein